MNRKRDGKADNEAVLEQVEAEEPWHLNLTILQTIPQQAIGRKKIAKI
jgi:hypothetical protein